MSRCRALSTVAAVNVSLRMPVTLRMVEGGSAGDADREATLRAAMAVDSLHHLVGNLTSCSHKEVIPLLGTGDATRFRPCQEGFEVSGRVIYTHDMPVPPTQQGGEHPAVRIVAVEGGWENVPEQGDWRLS